MSALSERGNDRFQRALEAVNNQSLLGEAFRANQSYSTWGLIGLESPNPDLMEGPLFHGNGSGWNRLSNMSDAGLGDYFNMSDFGDGAHGSLPATPFDDIYIRTIFIILYGAVFACCSIGNLLVIIVVLGHPRMRTTTNFFLANLALADLSVGIFCMLPNLGLYLSPHWMLGKVMCKLLYFVQMMAYAASIIILTVISVERYFAILHPFRCKQWKTLRLLRIIVLLIWLASAICGIPQMIFYNTVTVPQGSDYSDFCIVLMSHNKKAYVTTNFVLWYIVPLSLMTIMYTRISVVLWRTSRLDKASDRSVPTWTWKSSKQTSEVNQAGKVTLGIHRTETSSSDPVSYAGTSETETTSSMKPMKSSSITSLSENDSSCSCFGKAETRVTANRECVNRKSVLESGDNDAVGCCIIGTKRNTTPEVISERKSTVLTSDSIEMKSLVPRSTQGCLKNENCNPKSTFSRGIVNTGKIQRYVRFSPEDRTEGALLARRRVIRLLIVVIVCFALCVLPYHVLMLCQNWLEYGVQHTYGQMLASPIIFLIFYLNSALNPLLYAFLSDNFRRSLHELVHGQATSLRLKRARHGTLTCKTMNSSV